MNLTIEDFEKALSRRVEKKLKHIFFCPDCEPDPYLIVDWQAEVPLAVASSLGKINRSIGVPPCHSRWIDGKIVICSVTWLCDFYRAMTAVSMALRNSGIECPVVVRRKIRKWCPDGFDAPVNGVSYIVGPFGFDILMASDETPESAIERLAREITSESWASGALELAQEEAIMRIAREKADMNYEHGSEISPTYEEEAAREVLGWEAGEKWIARKKAAKEKAGDEKG